MIKHLVLLLGLFGAGLIWERSPALAQLPSVSDEPITPIPQPLVGDHARVALGAALFVDPRLSSSGKVSCSTCHDVRTNGASDPPAMPVPPGSFKPFNTLSVFNAALSFRLNWRGSALSLSDQADDALRRTDSMSANPDHAIATLKAEPGMGEQFQAIYHHAPDWPSLLDAISAYEQTLLTPDSRFDLWLKGDANALTEAEIDGYHLFKSVGCVSCHQGVGVGGNLFEKVGVIRIVLPDSGQIFRVPSLRNVAVLAPYFHDGSAATLDIAVSHMAAGQLGLNLKEVEIDTIVSFLRTLTGRYEGHLLSAAK